MNGDTTGKDPCLICKHVWMYRAAAADYEPPAFDFGEHHQKQFDQFFSEHRWLTYYMRLYVKLYGNTDVCYNQKMGNIIIEHAVNQGDIKDTCARKNYLKFMFNIYDEIAKPHNKQIYDWFSWMH